MNSLVDQYQDRYFDPRRGQVIGVNYGLGGQAIESELGLGNGKRMAGNALGIGIDGLKDLLYRPEIDTAGIAKGPYNPDTDDYGLELLLSGSPSFDLSYPKIPGKNLEGVPNANDPVIRKKLQNRLLKNPGGAEMLPGFLGRA